MRNIDRVKLTKPFWLQSGVNQQSIAYMFKACLHTFFFLHILHFFRRYETDNWKIKRQIHLHILNPCFMPSNKIFWMLTSLSLLCLMKIQVDHDNEKEKRRKKHWSWGEARQKVMMMPMVNLIYHFFFLQIGAKFFSKNSFNIHQSSIIISPNLFPSTAKLIIRLTLQLCLKLDEEVSLSFDSYLSIIWFLLSVVPIEMILQLS